MASDFETARAEKVMEANISLQGWLQRMVDVWQAAQAAVKGQNAANFGGFTQHVSMPSGMSFEVRPQEGVELEGRHQPRIGEPVPNGCTYSAQRPFTGAETLEASVFEVNRLEIPAEERPDTAVIGLNLTGYQRDETGVLRTHAIAFNFSASGILVPGEVLPQVEFAVVDQPSEISPKLPF